MDWLNHVSICEKCKQVDVEKTSTLINCCIVGVDLFVNFQKDISKQNVLNRNKQLKANFTQQLDGKSYKGGSKKVKELTRYK
jgi:hypothetical protein